MIKAIITDIEGTTTSLSFVKEVLFPYARERMADFVSSHGEEAEVRVQLDEVRALVGNNLSKTEISKQLLAWIDQDQKLTPLKALQGMLWEEGYRLGNYKGHIYRDAVRNLRKWNEQGIQLYVYSSGSVYAQKLLFRYSDHGDLTGLFSGYFDTRVGAKKDAASYRKIVQEIGVNPGEVLFLSDAVEELDAASDAGLHTLHLARDVHAVSPGEHGQTADFDTIALGSWA